MSSIHAYGLGKAYKKYPGRWSRFAEWFLPFGGPRHQATWVLRDVSFAVQPGEAVGVIGMNGAGKSTLLKLISGTTAPSEGRVEVSGHVAAMLELGMGFHPDFTGRQNVFMAGQLLGMAADEIAAAMPRIEEFAEIGEYIEQPVRTYSSGMQMRLAFSVATARRPDVLIVDEALSVGDAYFQHKSFDRIREFRELGTTLLIVSHDMGAIKSVCDRAILLNRGRVECEGAPEAVADLYNALLGEKEKSTARQVKLQDGRTQTVSGTGEATVTHLALVDARGVAVESVGVGDPVTLRVRVRIHSPIPRLVLGYLIKDRLGQFVYGTNTHHKDRPLESLRAGEEVEFSFAFPVNLGPGSYSVSTALVSTDTHLVDNYEWRDLALIFGVENRGRDMFIGSAWLDPVVTVSR